MTTADLLERVALYRYLRRKLGPVCRICGRAHRNGLHDPAWHHQHGDRWHVQPPRRADLDK